MATFYFVTNLKLQGLLSFQEQIQLFDSGNAVLGDTFTHTHTLKKRVKKVVNKLNRLSPNVNEFLAFGQIVFGFLYAHHSNKTNKK
jgi:hypothetical protein